MDWPAKDSLVLKDQQLPLMLMSYLGTLKTCIYTPLFNRWRPGLWSLRVPVLLTGAFVIWLFGRLLHRTLGPRAALLGCALLATDATFLLTTVFDWGPVALQHLLMVGGVLLVVAFAQEGSRVKLGFAFFFFGLAMWDKALASWWLGALGVSTLVFYPRRVLERVSVRTLTIAVLAFLAGAAPLIIFNVNRPLATFSGNARFSAGQLDQKVHLLKYTFDGSGLFGYIVREEREGPVRAPATTLERFSTGLRDAIGEHRRSLQFWGFLLALAAIPLWWHRRRPVLFALLFLLITWLQMAFTRDTGGGVHHTILMWPFPQFLMAAVLTSPRRPSLDAAAAVLVAVIAVSNLLVTNQYLCQFVRNGSGPIWTDAVLPLAHHMRPFRARQVFAMDWGIQGVLILLDRGQLGVWNAEENVNPSQIDALLATKGLFVTHDETAEINRGIGARLRTLAAERGYRQLVRATIADRNGRPIFYVSEFEKATPQ